ncbi:MAG: PP2C family protein-serine/threonine phosphatase [Bacteroidota bacterium]|jgi:sigma-B regulation protein RsbU (phosphoserine phosphatase)
MSSASLGSNKKLNELLFLVNKAIVQDVLTQDLLGIFSDFLKDNLQISKAALVSFNQEEKVLFNFGDIEITESELLDTFHPENMSWAENAGHKKSIKVPLYYGNKVLANLFLVGAPEAYAEKESLVFLQTTASLMMTAIENKKWYQEFKRKTELNKELELAFNVQKMLIPKNLPNNHKIQASAYFLPQQHLSGDYYDFVQISDDEISFCMADVTGKGIPAALLMSNFQANWRTLLGYFPNMMELVKELNIRVNSASMGEKFITCFIGKYSFSTRILSYVNAGHTAPVLFGGDNPLLLQVGCSGLGMLDALTGIRQGYLTIPKNSFLLCYTDGLVELENEDRKQFGVEKLIALIRSIKHEPTETINNIILSELKRHKGEAKFNDDVALLSLKFI